MRSECDVFEKLPNFHSHLESYSVFYIFKRSSHFQSNSGLLRMPELRDTFSVGGADTWRGVGVVTNLGVGISEVSVALCDITTSIHRSATTEQVDALEVVLWFLCFSRNVMFRVL